MSTKQNEQAPTHVAVRLDQEQVARIDALAARLSTDAAPVTRMQLVREAILAGLEVKEAQLAASSPAEPPSRES